MHIIYNFQQLEEKLSYSSVHSESVISIPNQVSPITESVATQVIDEFRDKENHKLNIIILKVPESVATETSACIAHNTKWVTDIGNTYIIDVGPVEVINIIHMFGQQVW